MKSFPVTLRHFVVVYTHTVLLPSLCIAYQHPRRATVFYKNMGKYVWHGVEFGKFPSKQ